MTLSLYSNGNRGGERVQFFYSQPPVMTPNYSLKYYTNTVSTTVSRRQECQIEKMYSLTLPVTPTIIGEVVV